MGKDKAAKMAGQGAPAGFVLFVAWFGALVYFVQQAQGFWEVILAFLKACVWPAIVLFHVLEVLGRKHPTGGPYCLFAGVLPHYFP